MAVNNTTAEVAAPVSAQTVQAHRDWSDASRAAGSVKLTDPSYFKMQARSRIAANALGTARNSDRAAFEKVRGWKFSKAFFTLRQLKEGSSRRKFGEFDGRVGPSIDHAEYLKIGRRPVAILSHSYSTLEQLQAFADKHELDAEFLSASWYYPGGAQAVLFTARGRVTSLGPAITVAEIAAAMIAKHYMRQLHWKRCRIVLWRPDETFPQPMGSSIADKKAHLRYAGLDPKATLPLWDVMVPLLPEAAPEVELSRRDAEGHKLRLSGDAHCAYIRGGILPVRRVET